MDGHLKQHLRTRRSSIDRTLSPRAPTFGSIATGTALRTREQARRELLDASERENVTNSIAHEESSTDMAVNEYERVNASEDTGSGDEGDTYPNIFEQSRMYMDEDQMLELRRKPPVAFVVRNAGKEEELQAAKTTVETTARPSRRAQSWHSPVHVPLSHRKLVQPLEIFKADPPFRPIAPRGPTVAKTRWREKRGAASSKMMQKSPKLMPMQTLEASDQLSHSAFVDKLRRKNKELFDRLVQRFAALRRVSIEEHFPNLPAGAQVKPLTSQKTEEGIKGGSLGSSSILTDVQTSTNTSTWSRSP